MSVQEKISALELELRQLKAAQSKVDILESMIADDERLLSNIRTAIAFDVIPIPAFASREQDIFQVSAEDGAHGLIAALVEFMERKIAEKRTKLSDALFAAEAIDIDGDRIVGNVQANHQRMDYRARN